MGKYTLGNILIYERLLARQPILCNQKSDYRLLTEQTSVSIELSFAQHSFAEMEEIVNYTLFEILTSEEIITVKRTSPTSWSNILRKFLKNNDKVALSEDDLRKKSTFISNFFRRKPMKKPIQRIVEEYKINFSEQILQTRSPSTVHYVLRNIKKSNKHQNMLHQNIFFHLYSKNNARGTTDPGY